MPNKSKNKGGRPRGIVLNSPQAVRRMLSRLVNETLRGELDTDTLRAVTYAANTILKCFETGELSDRLQALEDEIII